MSVSSDMHLRWMQEQEEARQRLMEECECREWHWKTSPPAHWRCSGECESDDWDWRYYCEPVPSERDY